MWRSRSVNLSSSWVSFTSGNSRSSLNDSTYQSRTCVGTLLIILNLKTRPQISIKSHITHFLDVWLGRQPKGQVLELRNAVRQPHGQLLVQELRGEHQLALQRPPAKVQHCERGLYAWWYAARRKQCFNRETRKWWPAALTPARGL